MTNGPAADWQPAFFLPNLQWRQNASVTPDLTLGLEGMAIASAGDRRVAEIRSWSSAADRFLSSFHDGYGRPVEPPVLIVRNDWMARFNRDPEPIVGFRNAVALCCVLPARTARGGSAAAGASWADTFDFHPAQLVTDGSRFDVITPALNQLGLPLDGLSLTRDVGIPAPFILSSDRYLARRLGRAWGRRYLRKRDRVATARVFRSLEMAYHAASVRFEHYASLSEVGIDAVFWVNAIEILAQPEKGHVTKWDGVKLVGEIDWPHEPRLQHRRYRHPERPSPGQPRKFRSLKLAEKIYLMLHRARSKFVHGDRVTRRLLLPFGDAGPHLLRLASTIYRLALVAYLDRHWPLPRTLADLTTLDLFDGMSYRRHLLQAVGDDEP